MFDVWNDTFKHAIGRAQRAGLLRPGIDAGDAAFALIAHIERTLSLARNSQDPEALRLGARGLRRNLDSMRQTHP